MQEPLGGRERGQGNVVASRLCLAMCSSVRCPLACPSPLSHRGLDPELRIHSNP